MNICDAAAGDTATLTDTLTKAAQNLRAVIDDQRVSDRISEDFVSEAVLDKGYHSRHPSRWRPEAKAGFCHGLLYHPVGVLSKAGVSHHLEDTFAPYPGNPQRVFQRPSAQQRADMDLIQYYVTHSRAQYALVMGGTTTQLTKGNVPCGPAKRWVFNHSHPI